MAKRHDKEYKVMISELVISGQYVSRLMNESDIKSAVRREHMSPQNQTENNQGG